MKILLASSEIVPFAKTGGLADVIPALAKSLKGMGHDVRVVMPKYKKMDAKKFGLKLVLKNIPVPLGQETVNIDAYEAMIPDTDVKAYFIANEKYLDRDELYQVQGVDYPDNAERFILFSRGTLEFLKKLGWEPHVLHANDWQSALMVAYVKTAMKNFHMATVFSVHNMGYQGCFPKEKMLTAGLGWEYFKPESLEFWGKVSFLKAGFVYADIISTVSQKYAEEIQTEEYGHGMDGVLRARSKDVYGIINGIDYDLWDPATDPAIVKNYSISKLGGKKDNKKALQKLNGLPQKAKVPVIGVISRLADQKGFDLIGKAIDEMMALDMQFVLLGTGDPKYHTLFKEMKQRYPEHIGVNLGFDSALAQLIYAGSDMFIMPSRYEPCGLGQLISFKYGTIPIVRKTGGLADTVEDYNVKTKEGSGFVFEDYDHLKMLDAIKRAMEAYKNGKDWEKLVKKVMAFDFSWDASAKKYVAMYKQAMEKVGLSK